MKNMKRTNKIIPATDSNGLRIISAFSFVLIRAIRGSPFAFLLPCISVSSVVQDSNR